MMRFLRFLPSAERRLLRFAEQPEERIEPQVEESESNESSDSLRTFVESVREAVDEAEGSMPPKLVAALNEATKLPKLPIGSERLAIALRGLPQKVVDLAKKAVENKSDSVTLRSSLALINAELMREPDKEKRISIAKTLARYLNANLETSAFTPGEKGIDRDENPEDQEGEDERNDDDEDSDEASGETPVSSEANEKVQFVKKLLGTILSFFAAKSAPRRALPDATLGDRLNPPAAEFDVKKQEARVRRLDRMIRSREFVEKTPARERRRVERQLKVEQDTLQEQQALLTRQQEFFAYVERGMPQYLSACGLGHIDVVMNRSKGRLEFRGMRGGADSEMLRNMVYKKIPGTAAGILPTGDSRQPYATLTINQAAAEGLTTLLGTAGMSDKQLVASQVNRLGVRPGQNVQNIVMQMPEGDERFGSSDQMKKSKEYMASLPPPVDIPYSEGSIIISFSYGIADKNPALKNIPGNRGANNTGFMIKNRPGNSKLNDNLQRLPFNERWDRSRMDQPAYKKAVLEDVGIRLTDAYQGGTPVATRLEFTRPIDPGEWVKINGKTYYGPRSSRGRTRYA